MLCREVIDDFPEVIDDFLEVIDDFPEVIDDFPEGIDHFPEGIDHFPEGIDDFPEGIDDFPRGIDDFPEAIDDFPGGKSPDALPPPSPSPRDYVRAGSKWCSIAYCTMSYAHARSASTDNRQRGEAASEPHYLRGHPDAVGDDVAHRYDDAMALAFPQFDGVAIDHRPVQIGRA